MSATPDAGADRARASGPALAGWVLFDWAQQPFYTLVTTFLFAPYFANVFVGNPVQGQAIWGYAAATAGLIVAVISPIMGAMADATGRRKPWIAAFSVLLVAATSTLWFATPDAGALLVAVITITFVLATVAAEASIVFINAMMPALVPRDEIGRLSGTGWAVGYAGGIVSLVIVAGLIVTAPENGRTLLGLEPIVELDAASRQADRMVGPFTAIWYIVFALPFFVFTPDARVAGPVRRASAAEGLRTLLDTLAHARRYSNILVFLLARMLYIDGLGAIFAFGGIYGAAIFEWRAIELGLFGIVLTVAGGGGAIVGGMLDDRLGAKPVILAALIGLIFAAIAVLSVDRSHVGFVFEVSPPVEGDGLLASTAERVYLGLAAVIGMVAGPLQASSRSLMARLAPAERMTQFFGLFAFSGKVTSFLAPLTVGAATAAFSSQRIGMATILVFLFAGLAVMAFVKTRPEGH